jgi:hypothetical protein
MPKDVSGQVHTKFGKTVWDAIGQSNIDLVVPNQTGSKTGEQHLRRLAVQPVVPFEFPR